jgi:hypothetical protein
MIRPAIPCEPLRRGVSGPEPDISTSGQLEGSNGLIAGDSEFSFDDDIEDRRGPMTEEHDLMGVHKFSSRLTVVSTLSRWRG